MLQFDIGHASFLVATRINYEDTSPLRNAFLSAVAPKAHLLKGEVHRKLSLREQKSKLSRNRWHLAVWLHNHESLRPLRKKAMAAVKEQQEEEEELRRQEEEQEVLELSGDVNPVDSIAAMPS